MVDNRGSSFKGSSEQESQIFSLKDLDKDLKRQMSSEFGKASQENQNTFSTQIMKDNKKTAVRDNKSQVATVNRQRSFGDIITP